jgi:hypothetical protein
MDKHDPPTSNGVFMPVGHVVISFASAQAMSAALADMRRLALGDEAITTYTAQEMQAQAQGDIERATGLASLGQDLNLVKAQLELANAGYHFLVVEADDDDVVEQVAQIAREHGAERAQSYGRFAIEELIDKARDTPQVAESPDRGLDT